MVKEICFRIQLVALVAVVPAFLLLDPGDAKYSLYVLMILWCLDKVRAWFMNETFGIHAQVKIKADAPKPVRFFGMSVALFILYITLNSLVEHAVY